MKVEILEEKLSSDSFVGEKGDRFTVPDDIGHRWCQLGWAKDLAGIVATGERKPGINRINVQNINQGAK